MQQKKWFSLCTTGGLLAVALGCLGQPVPRVRPLAPPKPSPQQVRANAPDTANLPLGNFRGLATKNVWAILADQYSMLRYANYEADADCKGPHCGVWKYTSHAVNGMTNNTAPRNWSKKVAWKRFPAGTVYGRWEIAIQPFPPGNDPNFTGLVRSGLVPTNGIDSVYFDLAYTDDTQMAKPTSGPLSVRPGHIGTVKPVAVTQPGQRPSQTGNQAPITSALDKSLLSKFASTIKGERTFYIRIVPLDANKNPLGKISNDITLKENFYEWKPAPQQHYLNSDYTITAVKYVPVHQPDPNFANCAIVTGYNGQPTDPFAKSFIAAFPVGTVLCPQPPKDKAWYEKAFDGVTGFVQKTIDGAANFYNETKGYLKKKFKEFNCNANGTINVVNPVTKLQEVAGPEVCEAISGAAFDYGMTAVGLPPSLPNTDDLALMAEGQIVEVACDKIEKETGLPVPDDVRAKLQKEFHDNVVAQSNKGTVNAGFLQVKPHPQGQFRPAYLEIEVTRTGNTASEKGLVGFSVSDVTTRSIDAWSPVKKQNLPVDLKGNLFVDAYTSVPFLEKLGDKTTVYIVLKPQESYVHTDKKTGGIGSVQNSPPLGEFHTPPTPTYQGLTYSPGFQLLCNGSVTQFSLGLKMASGVNTAFPNK
jgi:hypothetical protein